MFHSLSMMQQVKTRFLVRHVLSADYADFYRLLYHFLFNLRPSVKSADQYLVLFFWTTQRLRQDV